MEGSLKLSTFISMTDLLFYIVIKLEIHIKVWAPAVPGCDEEAGL